jgi:hypothetical protein
MLQVARLAPKLLGSATENIESFIRSRQAENGGFCNRVGNPDLYYTIFAIGCLQALQVQVDLEKHREYLQTLPTPDKLDFVHLASFARAWSVLPDGASLPLRDQILHHLEKYRAKDGGYHNAIENAPTGTAYGNFLALGTYQDLGCEIPNLAQYIECLHNLILPDGSFANGRGISAGLTTTTAGAVATLHNLNQPIPATTKDWLLSRFYPADGGFFAAEEAPVPDLLSTATALHALVTLQADLSPIKEATLDFLDSLWSSKGGFHGNWTDEDLDPEYTYYGLLSLGHLALV